MYANENFPLATVEALRRRGHDMLTSAESGRAGQAIPDEEVLAFAISSDRAVLTFDRRDFIRLHSAVPDHAGIVVCTADADFDTLAERIHAEVATIADLRRQLVRVYRPK